MAAIPFDRGPLSKQAMEVAQRLEEIKKLGKPRFELITAAVTPPEKFEIEVVVNGEVVEGYFMVKRLNHTEKKRWQNAGQEVNLKEDVKSKQGGAKVQIYRDLSEEDSLLLDMCLVEFKMANGKTDKAGKPIILEYPKQADENQKTEFLTDLEEEPAEYIGLCCRAFNGLALKNVLGVEQSTTSSTNSNTNTASTTEFHQEEVVVSPRKEMDTPMISS